MESSAKAGTRHKGVIKAAAGLSLDCRHARRRRNGLRALIGHRPAFGDVVPSALPAFASGGTQFSVAGVPIDRNAFVAEAGLAWKVSPAVTVGLNYVGQIGERAQDNGVKGSVIYRF